MLMHAAHLDNSTLFSADSELRRLGNSSRLSA